MKGEYALKKIHSLKRIQQVEEPENGCLEDDFIGPFVWAFGPIFKGVQGGVYFFSLFFLKSFC